MSGEGPGVHEDIKQYEAAIVHGCASTGTWNAATRSVRRGVEVGMRLQGGPSETLVLSS